MSNHPQSRKIFLHFCISILIIHWLFYIRVPILTQGFKRRGSRTMHTTSYVERRRQRAGGGGLSAFQNRRPPRSVLVWCASQKRKKRFWVRWRWVSHVYYIGNGCLYSLMPKSISAPLPSAHFQTLQKRLAR